jgi:DNA gyrase subunit A
MTDEQDPNLDGPDSVDPPSEDGPSGNPPPERTLQVDLEDEMKRSYLDYAMSVIVSRALPDVRDGLKPVHRRVLYGMWEAGNLANRPYKKSARIVGDVMGKYHPHGDSAIYDTVVRMAQDFSLRYPLVDGQGNFGSVDGDNPAAMRYTEVRLTRLAQEMLREDIDKETVDWIPNYDGSEMEPEVLPARLPNLLINGSSGIAVGMATNIPPHNLGEVIDGLNLLMDNPDVTLAELLQVIPGPDFPTGSTIIGDHGIQLGYSTGRGTIIVRGKSMIEDLKGDRQAIIISEIPYQVNKARLIEKMADLVREKRLDGISDLRDESDRDGMRIVIELKRGVIADVILNQLYKMTPLQSSFGMNMLAIVDNQPQVLTLKEFLQHFLNHRRTIIIRRSRYDLRKAEERAHILEGLLKALDLIDEIITTIRASETPPEAKENLISQFAFSDVQAQAILEMRLQRLTGLEREKLLEEYEGLMKLIEKLRALLNSDQLLLEEIRSELAAIREAYSDPRRTDIVEATGEITIEDMIADDEMVITVSNSGYVKRTALTEYRAQARGGKGRRGMATKDDDFVEHLFVATAHSYVLVITDRGHLHWLKAHRIPELDPAARGKAIINLLNIENDEQVAAVVPVRDFPEDLFLVFATVGGTIKKTRLAAYSRPRPSGIRAIKIGDDDTLLSVRVAQEGQEIFMATRNGYSVRFPESDTRAMGRVATGVRGIKLRPGDSVVSMEVLDDSGDLMTVSENGYGKRTALDEYRLQGRGGMGIINLKVSKRTGPVIGVRQVHDEQGVMLITQEGKIIRINAGDVSRIGRSTQGVRVMDLDEGDSLVAMAKIVDSEDDDDLDDDLEGSDGADGNTDVSDDDASEPEDQDDDEGSEDDEPVN